MSYAIEIGEKYGRPSFEASVIGCGLDRFKSEHNLIFKDDDIQDVICIFNKYKEQIMRIENIGARRDIVEMICCNDWKMIEKSGIKISNEDKEIFTTLKKRAIDPSFRKWATV